MPVVKFSGKISPAVYGVTVDDPPTFKWRDEDFEVIMTVKVQNDVVTVECNLSSYDGPNDGYQCYRRAVDVARATVDLGAFAIGKSLTIILDEITEPDGQTRKLTFSFPDVESICTVFQTNKGGFANAVRLVVTEPPLMWALRDLIETIEVPNRTPLNCARVIEALRNQIAPTSDRKLGWALLRSELHISEASLREITDNSVSWRHGDRGYLDGETTTRIRVNTWKIMNRFLEYRKRGSKSLPLVEFETL